MSKEIYSFKVNKKVKKEIIEEQGDTKITRSVEALEPVTIVIKKPTRQDSEAADKEYAIEQSSAMRAGIYTKAMVHKMLETQGFLDSHRKTLEEQGKRLQEIETEFQELHFKTEKEEADKIRLRELESEWDRINVKLQELANSLESAYQNTAESRAERKVITYLTLLLTNTKDGENLKPIFKGDSYEAKLKHSDALIENGDPFYSELADKAGLVVGLWYLNKAQTTEDFDKIFSAIAGESEEPEEVKEEASVEVVEVVV